MNAAQLGRVKQALIRDLDQALQVSYHQRLGEVINDLRVHDIELTPNPTPDEVFALLRQTRLLYFGSTPMLVELRESIERAINGTIGRCVRCGHAIAAETLEQFPRTKFCHRCAATQAKANRAGAIVGMMV